MQSVSHSSIAFMVLDSLLGLKNKWQSEVAGDDGWGTGPVSKGGKTRKMRPANFKEKEPTVSSELCQLRSMG